MVLGVKVGGSGGLADRFVDVRLVHATQDGKPYEPRAHSLVAIAAQGYASRCIPDAHSIVRNLTVASVLATPPLSVTPPVTLSPHTTLRSTQLPILFLTPGATSFVLLLRRNSGSLNAMCDRCRSEGGSGGPGCVEQVEVRSPSCDDLHFTLDDGGSAPRCPDFIFDAVYTSINAQLGGAVKPVQVQTDTGHTT